MGDRASPPSASDDLDVWLDWQERLHPAEIELGLDRIRVVLDRLEPRPAVPVITIAGTNGKGSCAGLIAAILSRAGYRPGLYTSPHIRRYTERVQIADAAIGEPALCRAFARVEQARAGTPLTYFEFGTLAAFTAFAEAGCDVLVLEVGLGGRLDAVNLLAPDVAVVTCIGLDHQDWLGPDRDAIGREKAGILRRDRPAVCVDPDPPAGLLAAAAEVGAELYLLGRDLRLAVHAGDWDYADAAGELAALPAPRMPGPAQYRNAAAALAAVRLAPLAAVPRAVLEAALTSFELPGRFQRLGGLGGRDGTGPAEWILDVAHNPDAAAALSGLLRASPVNGRTLAVIGMLADKDAPGVVAALADAVDVWFAAGLGGSRGRDGEAMAEAVGQAVPGSPVSAWPTVAAGMDAARAQAGPEDRILVVGSFLTVAAASEYLTGAAD